MRNEEYIVYNYPLMNNDFHAALIEPVLEQLQPEGMLGGITSQTGFILKSVQRRVEEILLKERRSVATADLSCGILYMAMRRLWHLLTRAKS